MRWWGRALYYYGCGSIGKGGIIGLVAKQMVNGNAECFHLSKVEIVLKVGSREETITGDLGLLLMVMLKHGWD